MNEFLNLTTFNKLNIIKIAQQNYNTLQIHNNAQKSCQVNKKMLAEEILINQVQSYLKQNMNIHLSLPDLNLIPDSKVTLKFVGQTTINQNKSSKQGVTVIPTENRYVKLIKKSQQLLNNSLNQRQRISEFGNEFFSTITEDIRVLMSNQQIRKNFLKVRQKILLKDEQIEACSQKARNQCLRINDKEDVVTFFQSTLKMYFQQIKNLKEHYEGVKAIELFTSINIDYVYQDNITSQEDYCQHFEPLLEVMQRLKSNLMKIYQQIFRCQQFQVPLKCVNFLANCRNLLLQLELFLMDQTCTYNRLIFYVVQAQRRNLLLITSVYDRHINFVMDILSDTFKCFFFGYVFKDNFREINFILKQGKKEIIKMFQENQISLNSNSFDKKKSKLIQKQEIVKKERNNLAKVKQKIRILSHIMGCGKDSIMHQYIRRKQCKKMGLLVEIKLQRNKLQNLIAKIQKYCQANDRIEDYLMEFEKVQDNLNRDLKQIEKGLDMSDYMAENGKSIEDSKQKKFKQNFLKIQQCILTVSGFIQKLNQYVTYENEQYFRQTFFPKKIDEANKLIILYMDLQTKLLNSFETMRKQKELKKFQAQNVKGNAISQIYQYLNEKVPANVGFDVVNEDGCSEEVKIQLERLDKAMYMVQTHLKNQQEFKELDKLKLNLEWLLIVFQGSMDDRILESMIDKLDFERQDWKVQYKKVENFMKDISIYVKDLKEIQKATNIAKIDQKVLKIVKDRFQLYQLIQDIFTQSMLVFSETKKSKINIQAQGAKLFDQVSYRQVLKMYQFKNKLRTESMELQELLIPQKTKNYLTDQICEPFMQKFYNHISYSQDELLNFTLRFQHSIFLDKNFKTLQNDFLSYIQKAYHEDYFSNILQVSGDLVHIGEQNDLICKLQHQKITIHNLVDFKDKAKLLQPYIKLAQKIKAELPKGQLRLQIDTKDQNVLRARKHLKKIWNQKNSIEERSQAQISQKRRKDSQKIGATGRIQDGRNQKQRQKQNDKYGFILGKSQREKISDESIINDNQYDLNKMIQSSIKTVEKKFKENVIEEMKKVDPKQIINAAKSAYNYSYQRQ